ncbi:hypothetical protein [Leifsonia sp. 2MCAF36]|uniref:hypothetical protein n=1 Tax=Leifsonia sp. 2MCAF36 TaxID=3232988 RepID=UPI003F9D7DDE
MPTTLLRTQITHTPSVTRALQAARETWSAETDGKLLLHLIEVGERALREQRDRDDEGRRAEIARISGRYAHAFIEGTSSFRGGRAE